MLKEIYYNLENRYEWTISKGIIEKVEEDRLNNLIKTIKEYIDKNIMNEDDILDNINRIFMMLEYFIDTRLTVQDF